MLFQYIFSKYHFKEGGYNLKWFKIKIGRIYIPLPNTKDRIAAVKIHDIHHILTEYKANLKGEAEIGAWEIASGCGPYYVAWVLNFASFFYGLFFFPAATFRAFLRGRSMSTNLYYSTTYNDELLSKTIDELRKRVGINEPRNNSAKDYFLLILCCALCLSIVFTSLILTYLLLFRLL